MAGSALRRTLGRVGRALRPGTAPVSRPPASSTLTSSADYAGRLSAEYAPKPDGRPDPGEIVWTWVPFEDDPSRGKDRPVLLVGHDPASHLLLGLMLTSKDHHRDAAHEAMAGRHWVDVGSGAWDRQGRPSEVRTDRILRIDPTRIRREGATIDRATYDRVIAAVHRVGR